MLISDIDKQLIRKFHCRKVRYRSIRSSIELVSNVCCDCYLRNVFCVDDGADVIIMAKVNSC